VSESTTSERRQRPPRPLVATFDIALAELRRDVLVFVERTGFHVSSEQAQRVEEMIRAAFHPVAVG